jgi:hypothetical protein
MRGHQVGPCPLGPAFEHKVPGLSPASHLQKLFSCWPLLGVLGQGQLEEVVEILGPNGHKSPRPDPD